MKPLRTQDLRHQVEIRRPTQSPNGKGGFVTTWPIVASVWAQVEGLNGRESVMEKVLQGISVKRVRIRWRDDIRPSDQLRYGSTDLNILSNDDPDGRREQLVLIVDTDAEQLTAEQVYGG
jgi:SPP1 family predicted phage head-tail adaptor